MQRRVISRVLNSCWSWYDVCVSVSRNFMKKTLSQEIDQVTQLVKKFFTFYRIPSFTAVFIKVPIWSHFNLVYAFQLILWDNFNVILPSTSGSPRYQFAESLEQTCRSKKQWIFKQTVFR
jgi:hypothetical protein